MHAPSSPIPQGYDELSNSAALVDPGLRLVLFEGEDRKGWLQGQVTQNLRDFGLGWSTDACLVAPTGQLQAILRLWSMPDAIAVLTEAIEPLIERAAKFVVMEDVRARLCDHVVLSLQGPQATRALGELIDLPTQDVALVQLEGNEVFVFRSRRTFAGGWDIAMPSGSAAESALRQAFSTASRAAWDLATLEAGIPVFGVDTDSKTLPPEMGYRFDAQHVSYSKGCYTGQEVLMRIHSRGHTNRTWVGLYLESEAQPGDVVSGPGRADAGRVTRVAHSPHYGWIAGAMLRNDLTEPGTVVMIKGQAAEVAALPFHDPE